MHSHCRHSRSALTAQPQPPLNTVAAVKSPKVSEAKPTVDTFELSAKSTNSTQYIKLAAVKDGSKIETQFALPAEFFIFDKKGALESYSGIDFKVENANASKVIFESKIMTSITRIPETLSLKTRRRRGASALLHINLEDLGDKRNFNRDEVISILENIQKTSEQIDKTPLFKFVDRLYASEQQEVIKQGGDPVKFLGEIMSEPIDFDRYLAEYKVVDDKYKGFANEYLYIRFVNPDNLPVPRAVGKKIETRPGEVIFWMIDGKELFEAKDRNRFCRNRRRDRRNGRIRGWFAAEAGMDYRIQRGR